MSFRIEFSDECENDFELIFDHLFRSYVDFGEDAGAAMEHAARRTRGIRLATFPVRGTLRNDILPAVRHLTIDRATYWFEVDVEARTVRILAIFFGGQDHIRHMLVRLLRQSERR